jgi:hypothetical protein
VLGARDTGPVERLFDSEPADDTAFGERPQAPAASAPPPGGTSGQGRDTRPLAVRVRPRGLDEFVGQEHLLGEGSALRTAIEQGRPHSMILYGPPGSDPEYHHITPHLPHGRPEDRPWR